MTLVQSVNIEDIAAVEVAPGITRRDLTATAHARGWIIDFAPGTQWPEPDLHDGEERYFILEGEIIEGERRHGPGSYVVLAKGSTHQPRSESGARMLGINIIEHERPATVDIARIHPIC